MEFLTSIALLFFLLVGTQAIGQQPSIAFTDTTGGLKLGGTGSGPIIIIDSKDWPGVTRAGNDLANDFGLVTGTKGKVASNATGLSNSPIIIAGKWFPFVPSVPESC